MNKEILKRCDTFSYHYNETEKHVTMYKELLENKDIIDVGSNIGFFSLAVCNNIKYKSLHLFEPSRVYFEDSKIILKDYNNIYYNNYGLGNIEETNILYKSPDNNIGWNTFLKSDPNQQDNFTDKMIPEECQIKVLDNYYKDIDNIDFIKIDVEGYEHNVLECSLQLIEKFKPYLFVEVGWGKNHPEWKRCKKVYRKIFDIGYKNIKFQNQTQDVLFEPFL
jgi:FkbM family methyltransferase